MSGLRPFHAAGIALLVVLALVAPALVVADRVEAIDAFAGAAGRERTLRFSPLAELDPAGGLVLLAPQVGYSADEVRAVRSFLDAGGRVLLADDVGAGRDLLAALGVGITTTGARVYTPGFEERPDRIVAEHTGALAGWPEEVVTTRPVEVVGGIPLLVTPELAWADLNDNGRPDLDEPVRQTVVAALQPVGRGLLVVVGDPDLARADEVGVALLRAVAPEGSRLEFDLGHTRLVDPFGVASVLAGRASVATGTAILMLAAGIAALAVLAPRLVGARRARARTAPKALDRVSREALAELE